MVGQTIVTAGLVVSVRQSFTKDKRPFVSAVLEDFGGSIEVTAWAEVYERSKDLWQEGNTLLIKGKVRAKSDRIQVTCLGVSLYQPGKGEESAKKPEQSEAVSSRRRLKVNLTTTDNADTDIIRLRQLFNVLKQFPGQDRVYLIIVSGERTTKLEVPDITIEYSPELHRHLIDIISEQDLIVEEGMS
jgi:DNA polymerase-3 subunit alpha